MKEVKAFWDSIFDGNYNKAYKYLQTSQRKESHIDKLHSLCEFYKYRGVNGYEVQHTDLVPGILKRVCIVVDSDKEYKHWFTAVREDKKGKPCPKGTWGISPLSFSIKHEFEKTKTVSKEPKVYKNQGRRSPGGIIRKVWGLVRDYIQ